MDVDVFAGDLSAWSTGASCDVVVLPLREIASGTSPATLGLLAAIVDCTVVELRGTPCSR